MSARANASAKNRRAGEPQGPPQRGGYPGQQQQHPQQQQRPPQPSVKLSISDAMALVTLRLGRVEQILHNMPVDGPLGNTNGDNIRIIDDELLNNILQRLDRLDAAPSVSSSVPDDSLSKLSASIESLSNEIKMTKELLMQMQLFSLKTDKKITDLEFKIEGIEGLLSSVNFEQFQEQEGEQEEVVEGEQEGV